ncbi:MAG: hypothetical protein Kow00109_19990 [Acidobacteriota bacterium]
MLAIRRREACLTAWVFATWLGGSALLAAAAGGREAPAPNPLEKSLVRVQVARKYPGLVVRGRWVPESMVVEVLDLGGIVLDDEGHVGVFTVVPWIGLPEQENEFTVRDLEGRETSAHFVGVDQRVSLLLVQAPGLRAKQAEVREVPAMGEAVLVYWEERGWDASTIWIKERQEVDPPLEIQFQAKVRRGVPPELRGTAAFLCDDTGRLMGIVTSLDKVGFSRSLREIHLLPASTLRQTLAEVRRKGSIWSGWLGVLLDHHREDPVVSKVFEESAAAKAGFREGDRILKIGGRPIRDKREFVRALRWRPPQSEVSILVEREGRPVELRPRLDKWPTMERPHFTWALQVPPKLPPPDREPDHRPPEAESFRLMRVPADPGFQLGFLVDPLTPQLAEFFKVPQGFGLLVKGVNNDSPAGHYGFRAGDVLVEINGQELRSTHDLSRALERTGATEIEIVFVRDGLVQKRRVVLR